MSKEYRVNEWFYSLQGEGVRAGSPNLFLRFSGCNESCARESHGFDCDTEFVSGTTLTADQIVSNLKETNPDCPWVILTGGEPALQVDEELIKVLKSAGYKLAIETNGSVELPEGLDWITVSPKVAEHALRQCFADEVKYVRSYGQAIPKTRVTARHKLISPAFDGDVLNRKTLQWCIRLVKDNPDWALSVQQHKIWKIR